MLPSAPPAFARDERLSDDTCGLLSRLIAQVPVYHLECLPDAAAARLQPGDVVLFRCCGRHILHRIVRRDGERLTLAGDGNYRITEQCTTRDVAGIAVRVIRASGRVVSCDSPGWQLRSRLWLAIPPWLRRQVLRVLWHSGWK